MGLSSPSSSSVADSPPCLASKTNSPLSYPDSTTHSVQQGLSSSSAADSPPCLSSISNSSLSYPDTATTNSVQQDFGTASSSSSSSATINDEIGGPVGGDKPQEPYLQIVSQPQSSLSFRYKTEMKKIYGAIGSEEDRQSCPTVRLCNYNPRPSETIPIIRCTLCTSEGKLHVHRLVSKQKREEVDDPHDIQVTARHFTVRFSQLAIVPTKKKCQVKVLRKKIQEHKRRMFNDKRRNDSFLLDEGLIRREVKNMKGIIDIACLKFEALIDNGRGEYIRLCDPVYSSNIYNSRNPTFSKLEICKASHNQGPCTGGQKIIVLTKKLDKNNISIQFFESSKSPNHGWQSYVDIGPDDVHQQCAIIFRTPPYKNQNIQENVTVYYRIVRSTQSSPFPFSNSKKYTYLPCCRIKSSRKRRRLNNTPRTSTITSLDSQPKPVSSTHVMPSTQLSPCSFPFLTMHNSSQLIPSFPNLKIAQSYPLNPQSSISACSNSDPLISQSTVAELSNSTFPNTPLSSPPLSNLDDLHGMENDIFLDTTFVAQFVPLKSSPIVEMSGNDTSICLATLSGDSSQITQRDDSGYQAQYSHYYVPYSEEVISSQMMPEQVRSRNDPLVADGYDRPPVSSSSSNEVHYLSRDEGTERRLEGYFEYNSSAEYNFDVIFQMLVNLLLIYINRLLIYITLQFRGSMLHIVVAGIWSIAVEFISLLALKMLRLYHNLMNTMQERQTPLLEAARSGDREVVSLLLEAGSRVDAIDLDGNTALHLAVMRDYGELEIVSVLLHHYPFLMSKNKDGYTALHLAVKWKKAKLVYHLCKNSDNTQLKDFINCRDNDGNTPLHLAVISRSKDVIVELLKFEELNINAKNFVSQTSLALVWGKNDTDAKLIQEILLASKADPLLIKFVNESEEGSEDEEDDSQEDYLPLTYYEDMAYPSPTVSEDESEDSEDDDDDSHEDHTPDCENVDYPSLIESEDESEEEDSEQDDDSHEDSSPMADYGEVTSYTVVRRRHLQVDVKRD